MRRLTPLWIFILVFAAGIIYLPGLSKYLGLKRKEDELTRKITDLQNQISALKKEEYLLRTDLGYLEQVVRKELGLVKPGEMIYKVAEEETSPSAQSVPK